MAAFRRVFVAVRSFRREAELGFAHAASWFGQRFYYRYCHGRLRLASGCRQHTVNQPLSLIVPAVEKDAEPLKHCLKSANQMIRHAVAVKLVIGPSSQLLRDIASEAGWEFVLEDNFLPRPAGELKCRGWMLQQFIKFNAALLVPTDNYLVLDSDTVFLKPQAFFRGGKTVLRYSDQYELMYSRSLELIFGHRRRFPVSFVTHHMVFNRKQVKQLLLLIEDRFGKRWWKAILQEVDKGHLISFSEFELYGNYIVSQPAWRKQYVLEHWRGWDRHAEEMDDLPTIYRHPQKGVNSVSFHQHTQ